MTLEHQHGFAGTNEQWRDERVLERAVGDELLAHRMVRSGWQVTSNSTSGNQTDTSTWGYTSGTLVAA